MIIRPSTVTTRYRVAEVLAGIPEGADPYAFVTDVTEYKTRDRAEKALEKLAKAGKTGILQVGILRWMPEDEAAEQLTELARRLPLE